MQAQKFATSTDDRLDAICDALKEYQKNGGSYKDVEKNTGISRTSISMLANHGLTLPEEKLVKIEAYLASKQALRATDLFAPPSAARARNESAAARDGGPSMDQLSDMLSPFEKHTYTAGTYAPVEPVKTRLRPTVPA